MARPLLALAALLLVSPLVACGSAASEGSTDPRRRRRPSRSRRPNRSRASTPDTLVPVGAGPVGLAADGDGGAWVVLSGDDSVVHLTAAGTEPDVTVGGARHTAARGARRRRALGHRLPRRGGAADRPGDRRGHRPHPHRCRPRGHHGGVRLRVGRRAGRRHAGARRPRVPPDRGAGATIGDGARLVVAGRDALWVAQFAEDRILRIDPRTLDVRRSPRLCSGPQGMAEVGGTLWVACTFADRVVPVDVRTLDRGEAVDVAGLPDPVVTDGGRVLVLAEEGPRLVVLDPVSRRGARRAGPRRGGAALRQRQPGPRRVGRPGLGHVARGGRRAPGAAAR